MWRRPPRYGLCFFNLPWMCVCLSLFPSLWSWQLWMWTVSVPRCWVGPHLQAYLRSDVWTLRTLHGKIFSSVIFNINIKISRCTWKNENDQKICMFKQLHINTYNCMMSKYMNTWFAFICNTIVYSACISNLPSVKIFVSSVSITLCGWSTY